jgi:dTDP-4-dehydrorhamnose 3,5-epimerase-like enzyme
MRLKEAMIPEENPLDTLYSEAQQKHGLTQSQVDYIISSYKKMTKGGHFANKEHVAIPAGEKHDYKFLNVKV